MSAVLKVAAAVSVERRVDGYDWTTIGADLDAFGCATLQELLAPQECDDIAALYPHEEHFRSHIHMARHRFGKGEYRYFKYPLPDLVGELRTALYSRVAPFANDWNERMNVATRYPKAHADYLKICHTAGQTRPTPLLLNTLPGISIACTRTFTAISPSRCRSPCCCRRPDGIFPAANSC